MPKEYKPYNSKEVEDKIYELWEKSGFFSPENLPDSEKKFVTCIAPPNITGELHMGHALEITLQDILVRMKRMQGYKTLWLPGLDHAGIAAQSRVEKELAKEKLTRHDLGREKFIERVKEWKEQNGDAILNQFKKMGVSVDWTRLRYTMDPDYQNAVAEAFKQYYEKGWIYQGERVINWCVRCATSISDLEVNYVPEKAKLYYIKYGPFTLATVRPETKLGDTALAVHPDDKRYQKYIGKDLEVDSVDSSIPKEEPPKLKKITLKVVADESVDPDFGTGIIKVTPAHDITDSEIGKRHNLPTIKIINEYGKMNSNAGIRYEGLKVNQAREQISKDLEELGLMEKIEDYEHNKARCDRCNSVIEPLPSKQWFLKMEELSKLALEALDKKEVKITPKRWEGPYRDWLNKLRDWNISRQLWWGHKIPLDGEDDVLDTWFSSALWPFATLGWPDKASMDVQNYYPTDFITSDRGILFLWQIRMVFSGKFFTDQAPFKNMFIHPTVLTKDGKRMSKSLGTGINPLLLTDKYGADALRFGLTYQTTDLQDMKFNEDTVSMGKKFANKIWNINRYIVMKHEGKDFEFDNVNEEMLTKFRQISAEVTKSIEEFKFGEGAHVIYDFIWHEFADKYIESTKDKNDEESLNTLAFLLVNCLKVLHPFIPFVTERLYQDLPMKNKKKFIMVENWPRL